MIYDANTWIGHWPFRALPYTQVRDLLKQMDTQGIDRALVGSLHGLFYKDAHEANRALVRDIARHRDRLTPCAIINPTYYGWRDDLRQCRQEFGMPVVRLVPDYHGYALGDRAARELVAEAIALDMRVSLQSRIVDVRGRHWLDPGRPLGSDAVKQLVLQFPGAKFLMQNFYRPIAGMPADGPELTYDISGCHGRGGVHLKNTIAELGPARCAYATTMLMRYPTAVRLALDLCDLKKRDRELVEHRTLERFLPKE